MLRMQQATSYARYLKYAAIIIICHGQQDNTYQNIRQRRLYTIKKVLVKYNERQHKCKSYMFDIL